MPRKGVPYGGTICSLKERIAEIWDKLGEKLHSINGVQGDGQGNVKIASGDPAVVITNDAAQNEIKIGLDNSKLPAAAVSSVNGETGAVVLNAGNIPTRDNANVQTDIDVGKAGLQNCIANINTEREVRQNADAALQANINAVQGRMTTAETKNSQQDTAIAALQTADAQNVKINNINEYAVGLTGNQNPISGLKTFISSITQKNNSTPGATAPSSYTMATDSFRIVGNDNATIIAIGFEKSTTDINRLVFWIYANQNTDTGKRPLAQIHFILNETDGNLTMIPAHIDKNGVRTFGTSQTLMTWTP